jgi:hypothetical protein
MVISGADRGNGPPFVSPQDIAVAADESLLVIEDAFGLKAVVRVDLRSGARTILSK